MVESEAVLLEVPIVVYYGYGSPGKFKTKRTQNNRVIPTIYSADYKALSNISRVLKINSLLGLYQSIFHKWETSTDKWNKILKCGQGFKN